MKKKNSPQTLQSEKETLKETVQHTLQIGEEDTGCACGAPDKAGPW